MPFQQSNNFGGNAANQQDKKKTNFRLGRPVYGSDAQLNLSIWNSDSATYTIFAIKQAIGKDPSTGANAYEQKAPNELPRVFLNPEYLNALITAIEAKIDILMTPKRGTTLKITGLNTNQIKMTIETEKLGNRTITFDAIPVGSMNIQSAFDNMVKLLKIGLKKALLAKLDPEEFGMVLGVDSGSDGGEEIPI